MTAAALLPRLAAAGIEAWSEGGRVRLRGREPSPDLLAELRARKAELLAELACQESGPANLDDWTAPARTIRDARLPAAGTPERTRLDRDHAATTSGYQHAALARPVSWSDAAALPAAGCYCRNCAGRAWWCELVDPSGWRCATCHPGDHLPPAQRRELRT